MKHITLILLFLFPLLTFGQKDTVIYFGPNGKLAPVTSKVLKKEIRKKNNKKVRIRTWKLDEGNEVLLFTENIKIKNSGVHDIRIKGRQFTERITRVFEVQPDGLFRFTERLNEQMKRKGTTRSKIPLLFQGEVTEYYSNGKVKSVSVYENNEMVSNENWLESGEKYIDDVFHSVDREPRFLRGTDLLHEHVLKAYRDSEIDLTQVEGRIVVGFVVMEDGSIDGLRIEQGLGRELNNLAVSSMNSLPGKWQPARINGKNVRFYQLFPINFIYQQFDFDFLELKGSMLYWHIN